MSDVTTVTGEGNGGHGQDSGGNATGSGNHGGNHANSGGHNGDGGGHDDGGHAEPRRSRNKNSKSSETHYTKLILTLVAASIIFGAILYVVNGVMTANRLEKEITAFRESLDKKADKTETNAIEEKLTSKADASLMVNQINNHIVEITGLRQSVGNLSESYQNLSGRYETVTAKREKEMDDLQKRILAIGDKIAKIEAEVVACNADLKQLRDVKIEKMTGDLTTVREKVAGLEASQKK